MAHFAELDDANTVLRVIVVSDIDCRDASGIEREAVGATFCNALLGGRWVQISYNGRIRGCYAGVGYTFDAENNIFVQPFISIEAAFKPDRTVELLSTAT